MKRDFGRRRRRKVKLTIEGQAIMSVRKQFELFEIISWIRCWADLLTDLFFFRSADLYTTL